MAYSYYRTVTIDYTKLAGTADLTNFTFPLVGTTTELKGTADSGHVTSANGYDIVFSSDQTGTSLLSYERESYVGSTGAYNFWIKAGTISGTANTVLYMWYGDSGVTTDQSNATATWNNGYVSVYHLGGTVDSTTYGYNLDNVNSVATATDAMIFKSSDLEFDGTAYMKRDTASAQEFTSNFTLETWVKKESTGGGGQNRLLAKDGGAAASGGWFLDTLTGGTPRLITRVGSTNITSLYTAGTVPVGTWTYIWAVHNDSTDTDYIGLGTAYEAGTGKVANPTAAPTYKFGIGADPQSTSTRTDGLFDEARLSNVARTPQWMGATYNSIASPSTFYGLGTEVPVTSGTTYTRDISSSMGLTDTLVGASSINRTASDELTLSDTLQAVSTANRNVSDELTLTDTIDFNVAYGRTLSDEIALTESNDSTVIESGTTTINLTDGIGINEYNISWLSGAFPTGWRNKFRCDVDHTKVYVSDHTDFPVLVSSENFPAGVSTYVNSDGGDLRFSLDEAGGTPLAFDVEQYGTAGTSIWVKIPTLYAVSTTTFYCWYNNATAQLLPGTATYGAENAWNSGYKAVWHLNSDSSATVYDSTNNNNDSTADVYYATTLQVDGAAEFRHGSSTLVDVPDSAALSVTGTATLSGWFSVDTFGTYSIAPLFGKLGGYSGDGLYILELGTSNKILGRMSYGTAEGQAFTVTESGTTALGATTYAVMTYNKSACILYKNGVPVGTTSNTNAMYDGAGSFLMGTRDTRNFDGKLDEIRVSNVARSAGWIQTEYANQSSPSTFMTSSVVGTAISVSSNMGVSESNQRVVNYSRSRTSNIALTDGVKIQASYTRVNSDSLGITDSLTSSEIYQRLLTSDIGITDTVIYERVLFIYVSDEMGITDEVEFARTLGRSITDVLTETDSVDRVVTVNRSLTSNLGLTDSISYIRFLYRTIEDTLGITDTLAQLSKSTRTNIIKFKVFDGFKPKGDTKKNKVKLQGLVK